MHYHISNASDRPKDTASTMVCRIASFKPLAKRLFLLYIVFLESSGSQLWRTEPFSDAEITIGTSDGPSEILPTRGIILQSLYSAQCKEN